MAMPGILWIQQHFDQRQQGDLCRNKQAHQFQRQPHLRPPLVVFKRTAVEAELRDYAGERMTAAAPTPVIGAPGSTSVFFAALVNVLRDSSGGRWLESIRELQCVCFEACTLCRELVPIRLRVSDSTPEHLWKQRAAPAAAADDSSSYSCGGCRDDDLGGDFGRDLCSEAGSELSSEASSELSSDAASDLSLNAASDRDSYGSGHGRGWGLRFYRGGQAEAERGESLSRSASGAASAWALSSSSSLPQARDLPHLRVAGMVWERRTLEEVFLGPDLAEITFGAAVIEPLHGVAWTSTLKRITLSSNWNLPPPVHDDDGGNWPPSLEELTFGEHFNQTVDYVAWPASLRRLTFGKFFNQSIDGIEWPTSLQHLKFGLAFDQPVDRVTWPPQLKSLVFGARFDRDISLSPLPTTLEQLTFGYTFNNLSFVGAVGPTSALRKLTFGHDFDTDIIDVAWPASLEHIVFGYSFNRPIVSGSGVGVSWPPSLQQLVFGACFNQSIAGVKWPTSLRRLAFGYAFTQIVDRTSWPEGLTHLSVDRWSPLSRNGVPNGVKIELT